MKRFSKEQLKKVLAKWLKTPTPDSNSEPHRVSAPQRTLVEGVAGTFYYHLSDDGLHSLCGAMTMHTRVPESAWGVVTHLHERYCPLCETARVSTERDGQELRNDSTGRGS